LDEIIGTLIRLGYTVGLAQDHSNDPEVEPDHVYNVSGFGVSDMHVWDEDTLRALVDGHDERVRRMAMTDAERLEALGN